MKLLDVLENLDEWNKKNKIATDKFEPEIIDTIKVYGDKGKMPIFVYDDVCGKLFHVKS